MLSHNKLAQACAMLSNEQAIAARYEATVEAGAAAPDAPKPGGA